MTEGQQERSRNSRSKQLPGGAGRIAGSREGSQQRTPLAAAPTALDDRGGHCHLAHWRTWRGDTMGSIGRTPGQCEGCTWVTSQVRELPYIHSRDVTFAVFAKARMKSARYCRWEVPRYSAQYGGYAIAHVAGVLVQETLCHWRAHCSSILNLLLFENSMGIHGKGGRSIKHEKF
jgi:hypothetical protein